MSTTRPCSPGDRGPEPSGASGASEEGAASAGAPMTAAAPAPDAPAAATAPATGVPAGANVADVPTGASDVPTGAGAAAPSGPADTAQGPGARRVRRLTLEGQSGVVPLARDFTRQALYAWGWLPAATADQRAAAEDVLLVVSELVTNACLHAEGPDELVLACDRKVIRLEVSDRGTGQPAPRTPHRAGRPGGHGMFIVQRLCLDWGVLRSPGRTGKTVWAELGAPS